MPIARSAFGRLRDGRTANRIVLSNTGGMSVEILDYGATIRAIHVPNEQGRLVSTVLSYSALQDYELGNAYLGSTIGRCAGRTATRPSSKWQLTCNEGSNHLHGGKTGFSHSVWRTVNIKDGEMPRIHLRHHSPAGEDGYPGNLIVDAHFRLISPRVLHVVIEGKSDDVTPINMTLHPYFNLNGDPTSSIDNHELQITADAILQLEEQHLPTGERLDVQNTPFDFRNPTAIGAHVDGLHDQLKIAGGYDHYWILNDPATVAAEIYSPMSAIGLRVRTNQKGLQFYSGNQLSSSTPACHSTRSGLCIEPHGFPNAMNEPSFPDITLQPGQAYKFETFYEFFTR